MQKKRIASMTAAAVMALSTAAAVIPASADTAVASAAAYEVVEASTATIKFNANGGTIIGAKKKTYKKGTTLGVLPNAKKANVAFDGWYTKKSGGKRVTNKTKLSKCVNKTFYAHWKVIDQPHLKWKWSNSFEGFDYPYDYHSPRSVYRYIFDKNYADWLYEAFGGDYGSWGGNCFGMSSTASFNVLGLTNVKTFNKKVTFTKEVGLKNKSTKLKLTAGQFCEVAQQIQFNWGIQEMYDEHNNKYQAIANAAKRTQKKKAKPIIIGVLDRVNGGGHALLAYKFAKGDKYSDKVYVYDCNYPESKKQYIELYKNSSGAYTGFRYHDFYDSYTDITYFPTATAYNVWKNRGTKKASGLSDQQRKEWGIDSAANATIYDAQGNVYATITNGVIEGGDVVKYTILADKWLGNNDKMIISLPAGQYTIKSNDGALLKVSEYFNGVTKSAEGSVLSF